MKKILILLIFPVFFSSCPTMEDTNEQAVWLLIKNKSTQVLNLNFKFEVPSWSGHCFDVYEEDLKGDSISNIQGFSYKEKPQNPFDFLMAECIKKQIVVTSLSGDTLANWNDTSAVFDPEYWSIEPLKSGDIHCTLQLTDEVLKLK
ncbi:MAG: hypothetical protein PUC42_04430 [Bacteroidales bacterium]|nr:hypothetical protein [Bacteroidales bacterium]